MAQRGRKLKQVKNPQAREAFIAHQREDRPYQIWTEPTKVLSLDEIADAGLDELNALADQRGWRKVQG